MSAFTKYSSLQKSTRRFIWSGYILYTVYIWLLNGFDEIIEKIVPTGNPIVLSIVAFGLYWAVIFLVLWAFDN